MYAKKLPIACIAALILTTLFTSCSQYEELQGPTSTELESEINPDILIVNTQESLQKVFEIPNQMAMALVRQRNLYGPYEYMMSGRTNDNEYYEHWEAAYNILQNRLTLEAYNELFENELSKYVGLAQVLESMAFLTLADLYDEVPYSQVKDPLNYPIPGVDSGAQLYLDLLVLLEDSVINLSETLSDTPEDRYFVGGFNSQNWIRLANTLKLKIYTNLRLIDPDFAVEGINMLLSMDIIDEPSEDFQYQHQAATSSNSPEGHPDYKLYFSPSNRYSQYMSNDLYDYMNVGDVNIPFIETGTVDPRARYYFYRQTDEAPSGSTLPCSVGPYYYCYVGNRYWGRDQGDIVGTPQDGSKRTLFGVYPTGGAFDFDAFETARLTTINSKQGKGIYPLFLSSFTQFMLAENALTLGSNLSTARYLERGIRQSMKKVTQFTEGIATSNPDSTIDYAVSQAQIEAYINRVIAEYNSASSDEKRINIIAREYYLAAFGNGIEVYNLYRRTGKPDFNSSYVGAQPTHFPRRFLYPDAVVIGNPNITQGTLTQQVFWDNNPAGFID